MMKFSQIRFGIGNGCSNLEGHLVGVLTTWQTGHSRTHFFTSLDMLLQKKNAHKQVSVALCPKCPLVDELCALTKRPQRRIA